VRRTYLLEGYNYSFEPRSIVTEFSTRNRRQRSLYKKRNAIFNVSERLSLSGLAEFEDWVNDTLNGGADSFIGSYWDGDVERTDTMNIVNGYYTFDHRSENDITVSYQVEIQERSMDDAAIIYNTALNATFTSQYYNLFEKLVNLNDFA
jgi:hypothetical protein